MVVDTERRGWRVRRPGALGGEIEPVERAARGVVVRQLPVPTQLVVGTALVVKAMYDVR